MRLATLLVLIAAPLTAADDVRAELRRALEDRAPAVRTPIAWPDAQVRKQDRPQPTSGAAEALGKATEEHASDAAEAAREQVLERAARGIEASSAKGQNGVGQGAAAQDQSDRGKGRGGGKGGGKGPGGGKK